MVRFIVGKGYNDVPAKLHSELIQLFRSNDAPQNVIYLVPDQFGYETEKSLYKALVNEGLDKRYPEISVKTFSAAAREIIAATDPEKARLAQADDIVKHIVMSRAIKECEPDLEVFGGIARKPGFCEKMVQTISMLKVSGISAQDMEQLGGNGEGAIGSSHSIIKAKLKDVGTLYEEYSAMLSRNYLDSLEVTTLAADRLSKSGVFSGTTVYVDGFNDFTQSQLMFLYEMIKLPDTNVTFGFVSEQDSPSLERSGIFYTINAQMDRLRQTAEEYDRQVEVVTEGIPPRIGKDSDLYDLCVNYCSCQISQRKYSDIEVYSAYDVFQELDLVAAKIRGLVMEKGLRYNQIAVLCTEPSQYKSYIISAFEKYGIPVFVDIPEPLIHQPFVGFITALLKLLQDFTVDNALNYVKSGFIFRPNKYNTFSPLSESDINQFESYIYEWGLKDDSLKKPFTRSDKGNKKPYAEEIRHAALEPVLALKAEIDRNKALSADERKGLAELIYGFICDEIDKHRELYLTKYKNDANKEEFTRNLQQIRKMVAEIFLAMHDGLKGQNIPLDEFCTLFRDICASTTLAKPPQNIDSLLVGDIDRTRVADPKAVFIVGATSDKFPPDTLAAGVFSGYETEVIRNRFISIDPLSKKQYCIKSTREQYSLSLYRAYRAMTLPTEYLCITVPDMTLTGEETERSQAIDQLLQVCPALPVRSAANHGADFYCRTPKAARQRYAELLYSDSEEKKILKKAMELSGDGEYPKRLDSVMDSRKSVATHQIDSRIAQKLFNRRISATKVENVNLCRFMYFCQSGLRIKERKERTFNSSHRGSAVHYIMQKILEHYSGCMGEFFTLDRPAISRMVNYYLEEYKKLEMADDFSDDKRLDFLFKNIAVAATDLLIVTQAEFAARAYRPKFFELELTGGDKPIVADNSESGSELPEASLYDNEDEMDAPAEREFPDSGKMLAVSPMKVQLDNGVTVFLTGIIDRVDMFTAEDGTDYMRVVDYKTNNRSFSVYNASNGINVQMVLYLFALCDSAEGKDSNIYCTALPGGVSYTPAKVSGAKDEKNLAFSLLSTVHKQSGMIVRDAATDNEANGYAEFFIQKLTKELSEGADLPTTEDFLPSPDNCPSQDEFGAFRAFCMNTIQQNLNELFSGSIDPIPLKYKEGGFCKHPCLYCEYKDICGNGGKEFKVVPDAKALARELKKAEKEHEKIVKSATKAQTAFAKAEEKLSKAQESLAKKEEALAKKQTAFDTALTALEKAKTDNSPKLAAAQEKHDKAREALLKATADRDSAIKSLSTAEREHTIAKDALTSVGDALALSQAGVDELHKAIDAAGFFVQKNDSQEEEE